MEKASGGTSAGSSVTLKMCDRILISCHHGTLASDDWL